MIAWDFQREGCRLPTRSRWESPVIDEDIILALIAVLSDNTYSTFIVALDSILAADLFA